MEEAWPLSPCSPSTAHILSTLSTVLSTCCTLGFSLKEYFLKKSLIYIQLRATSVQHSQSMLFQSNNYEAALYTTVCSMHLSVCYTFLYFSLDISVNTYLAACLLYTPVCLSVSPSISVIYTRRSEIYTRLLYTSVRLL